MKNNLVFALLSLGLCILISSCNSDPKEIPCYEYQAYIDAKQKDLDKWSVLQYADVGRYQTRATQVCNNIGCTPIANFLETAALDNNKSVFHPITHKLVNMSWVDVERVEVNESIKDKQYSINAYFRKDSPSATTSESKFVPLVIYPNISTIPIDSIELITTLLGDMAKAVQEHKKIEVAKLQSEIDSIESANSQQ
jgi:hypothetical protein